jgi:hypothetical protein
MEFWWLLVVVQFGLELCVNPRFTHHFGGLLPLSIWKLCNLGTCIKPVFSTLDWQTGGTKVKEAPPIDLFFWDGCIWWVGYTANAFSLLKTHEREPTLFVPLWLLDR